MQGVRFTCLEGREKGGLPDDIKIQIKFAQEKWLSLENECKLLCASSWQRNCDRVDIIW